MAIEEHTVRKQRVQFDLNPAMSELLDCLVKESGLATRAEVLRRAISIYAALLDEIKEGNTVEIKGRGAQRWRLRVI